MLKLPKYDYGDDYNIMFEVLSSLKYRKINIKSELIKYYNLLPENLYEDYQCSKQAKSIYKIGYKAITFNGIFMSMSILS